MGMVLKEICIGKHLVKYVSESIYQGEMCKSKGGRKLEEAAAEEVRVEDQNRCFSAALASPGAAPLWWEGRLCRLQYGFGRFMPCTPNTYRRLSTAQF